MPPPTSAPTITSSTGRAESVRPKATSTLAVADIARSTSSASIVGAKSNTTTATKAFPIFDVAKKSNPHPHLTHPNVPMPAELRSRPFDTFSEEEKRTFELQLKRNGVPMNFDRNPPVITLDVDNQIVGETPHLSGRYTKIKMVDKNNQEACLVKVSNDQAVLLIPEMRVASAEMMKTAATIMANSYKPLPNNKRRLHIGKKVTKKGSQLEAEAEEFINSMVRFDHTARTARDPGTDPLQRVRSELFLIDCHCNDVRRERAPTTDMVTCSTCAVSFHHDCVSCKSNSFTCTSCSVETEGLRWAIKEEKITNSCTVDNIFTGLAIRCEKSPQFKMEMERLATEAEDPMQRALGECTLATLQNESWKAQSTWVEAVVNYKISTGAMTERPKKFDLDGGTDEWMYNFTAELQRFYTKDLEPGCDHCGDMRTEPMDEILINFTTEPVKYLMHETPLCNESQRECEVPRCTGTKQTSPLFIADKERPPLFLKVRNRASLQGPEAFTSLPKEVYVSDIKYQLGTIVLYNKDAHHFTSLQHVNNEFISYDGLYRVKGKHHKTISRGDFIGPTIVVDSCLYYRCIGDEKV